MPPASSCARSRNQERTRGNGRMAALALAPDAARELLVELGSPAEIAAFNGTQSVTISGPGGEIERLAIEAQRRGLWFRALDLDFAFHSREMDPIREDLLASLAGLRSRPPAARLVSTVTGAVVDGEALGAEHWWRNIRNPVRFVEAAARLIDEGCRIFVEIGPSPILQSYLRTRCVPRRSRAGCSRACRARRAMTTRFRRLRRIAMSPGMI